MDYRSKLITVEEALGHVKSGQEIVTGMCASEAEVFLGKLHTIADRVKDVSVLNCLSSTDFEYYKPEYASSFMTSSIFFAGVLRNYQKQGSFVSYLPGNLHESAPRRYERKRPSIYVGAASLPDKHGYMSLGTSNVYEKRAMALADIVILEINPNMPRVFGDSQVHVSEVDYLIEADYKVPETPDVIPNDIDRMVGKFVADEVPDGACIQLGIGAIPAAVTELLEKKNDLGVHTEMMCTGMMRLAKMGVINGRRKQMMNGKMVTGFVFGTRDLYDFVDDNPGVAVMDGFWCNGPTVIAENDNQISINSTIEIDLGGQCASESIGSRHFSGTGGARDTARGAQLSKGGKSIVALHSTAVITDKKTGEKREVSKILPQLTLGAAVSISRNEVDIVATEYGAAHLRGANLHERAQMLIEIAHPKFRDELYERAYELGYMIRKR